MAANVQTISVIFNFDAESVSITYGSTTFTVPRGEFNILQTVQQLDPWIVVRNIVIFGKLQGIADGDLASLKTAVEKTTFKIV